MKIFTALLLVLSLVSSLAADHHESESGYPLETCIVSGEDLYAMGDPVVYWHKVEGQPDREVRFCCERCEGRFESNPAKYLALLDAAKTGAESCCSESACCAEEDCPACAEGTCEKACCSDGECESCAADHA